MTEKTLRQRVKEEAVHFAEIYADFKEDLKEKSYQGVVESNWLHLFGVPFDGLLLYESATDQARHALNLPHRHDAVLKAIQKLGVHKLRLGALVIGDDRITPALEAGLLTPDDIVPPVSEPGGELERLARRLKPDHSDPIFYRTLLEIFCRAFVASSGPKPWTLPQWIELAIDLDEIRSGLRNARWNKDAALKVLQGSEPYVKKYPRSDNQAGVGEDRVQKITDLIGPMDDEALDRLKKLFPDEFFKVADAWLHREYLQRYGVGDVLDSAENLADALNASSKRPGDG